MSPDVFLRQLPARWYARVVSGSLDVRGEYIEDENRQNPLCDGS
jgi:hypothetical protein